MAAIMGCSYGMPFAGTRLLVTVVPGGFLAGARLRSAVPDEMIWMLWPA